MPRRRNASTPRIVGIGEEASVDWTQPATAIDRQVRAFRPAPGAFTFHGGKRVKILVGSPQAENGESLDPGAMTSADAAPESIVVACGEGSFAVATVQPEGRQPMSAGDYLRGAGASLPKRFEPQPNGGRP